jgi:hypothetical protein
MSRASSGAVGRRRGNEPPVVAVAREGAVEHERVEVNVEIEATPKALDRGDGAGLRIGDPGAPRATSVEAAKRPRVHGEDLATELVVPCEQIPQAKRQAQHPLAHRHGGEDVVDEMRRPLGHPPPAAARTYRARFARERDETFRVARVAAKAREPSCPDTALEELTKLALHECRHAAGAFRDGKKRREVFADNTVEDRVLGGAGTIRLDRPRRVVGVVPHRRRDWRHRRRIAYGASPRDQYK